MVLLEVEDLKVNYGAVEALNGVSFSVGQGEIVALLGNNGAGKSTTLKALAGLIQGEGRRSGKITFDGKVLNGTPPCELVREGICLVPDGRRVFHSMTVLENIQMGGYMLNSRKQIDASLQKVFALFPVLKKRQSQRAGTLSGGEQQMLTIARALMLKPTLLLIDEPSLGLSPNYVRQVFDKLLEINKQGTTILMVEQNAGVALKHSNRAYVFDLGRIHKAGESRVLLEDETVREELLGL